MAVSRLDRLNSFAIAALIAARFEVGFKLK